MKQQMMKTAGSRANRRLLAPAESSSDTLEKFTARETMHALNSRKRNLSIKYWAAEDVPSVKAKRTSFRNLTNSELISIVIGSGTATENSVELSRNLLAKSDNSLRRLAKMSIEEIIEENGFGEIRASKVLAALELAARMNMEISKDMPEMSSATAVYKYIAPYIAALDTEEFWALYMNCKCKLIKSRCISQGGLTETLVDIRVILREALLCNATVIAVAHNHPSGSIRPSKYDDTLTENIKKTCEVMRIRFIDHVIVTDNNYYSYHENGIL